MRTFITLPLTYATTIPPELGPDIRYPEALVELFLQEFTQPGDVVFDPFTGYGTTLLVAERMGRIPYGLELDGARCDYVRTLLRHPERMILGDARHIADYSIPPLDFCITSPPYTNADDHLDPLTDYSETGTDYAHYLQALGNIYAEIASLLKPGGHAVIEIANLKSNDAVTSLAWDVCAAIRQVLHFEGEVVIGWEPTYGYGFDHSYCLVFEKIAGTEE